VRARARTAFVGRVGDDDFGKRLLTHLVSADVDTSRIVTDPIHGSGMSVAIQTAEGAYGAVVVSGANQHILPLQFQGLDARVLLIQNEIAASTTLLAARALKRSGAIVIHNMAPVAAVDQQLLAITDVIVANRVEAEGLTGEKDMEKAARLIAQSGVAAIVTMGENGCWVAEKRRPPLHVPAFEVEVVSTHGAGDAFCGTLAAELSRGKTLEDAAETASEAAAKVVSGG
jgi:ribokinase